MAMTAAWLEVLDISGVPAEQYEACYSAAVQNRAERRAKGEQLLHLTADELAAEWIKIRELHAELERQSVKMLPANAAHACPNCYGTGMERMPDGRVRPGCKHEGWTPEFETEIERNEEARRVEIKKQADFMKEALGKVGRPKPAADASKPKQAGTPLVCTNPACARKVNTLYGFEPGQTCNELLNRGTHDGELEFCGGTLAD